MEIALKPRSTNYRTEEREGAERVTAGSVGVAACGDRRNPGSRRNAGTCLRDRQKTKKLDLVTRQWENGSEQQGRRPKPIVPTK